MSDLGPILERIRTLRATTTRPVVLGISGIDCAGKSTTAAAIADALQAEGIDATNVSVDDFLYSRAVRNRNPDTVAGYLEETFDFATLFEGLLIPARRARALSVTLQGLDWERDVPVLRTYDVHAGTVIIAEGVFLFRNSHPDVFDLRVWLEIGFEEGLARAVQRPRDLAHYPSVDAIRARYQTRFYPAQRIHLSVDAPAASADIVVTGDPLTRERMTA